MPPVYAAPMPISQHVADGKDAEDHNRREADANGDGGAPKCY